MLSNVPISKTGKLIKVLYKPSPDFLREICTMKKLTFLIPFTFWALIGFSQKSYSINTAVFSAVTITNNGISLVPAFSLGKPATLFDLSVQRKKFSFDPQLAFGMQDAKPWYFVFWMRYKLIESSKFNLGLGVHPGFLFSPLTLNLNGINKEYITTSRFFVGCLTPNYSLTKDISIGLYLQQARGYNSDLKNGGLYGINMNFSSIPVGKHFFIRSSPQLYFLNNDGAKGSYLSTSITVSKQHSPFSVSTLLNAKIKSKIPGDNFLWNVSLSYILL